MEVNVVLTDPLKAHMAQKGLTAIAVRQMIRRC